MKKTIKPYKISKRGRVNEGRPTKYRPEYCQRIVDFFTRDRTREKTTTRTDSKGNVYTSTEEVPNMFPTFFQFAKSIGVEVHSISEWARVNPEFCSAYNACKELQKEFLMENGLAGHYPPASFIFIAKNITDLRDKTETDVTSGGRTIMIDI